MQPRIIRAELSEWADAGGDVQRLRLRPQEAPPVFEAGQYLLLATDDGEWPFSIASAPRELPSLELHFQPHTGRQEGAHIESRLQRAKADEPLVLNLPFGRCGMRALPDAPLVIIAAGTGITQARSILREHLAGARHAVHLYWGARSPEELYLHTELRALAAQHPKLRYIPAVEPAASQSGHVRPGDRHGVFRGNMLEAAAADITRGAVALDAVEVLLCGSPQVVYAAIERLRPLGLKQVRTRSDVLDYAPRDDTWR